MSAETREKQPNHDNTANLATAEDLFVVFLDRAQVFDSTVVFVKSLATLDWTPCPLVRGPTFLCIVIVARLAATWCKHNRQV